MKTNLKGHIQVVYNDNDNDKVNTGDDAFQLDELFAAHQVASSTDLKENLNFHVTNNIFIDVNTIELNDILRLYEHT